MKFLISKIDLFFLKHSETWNSQNSKIINHPSKKIKIDLVAFYFRVSL
jgi:hypothetical protein